MTDNSTHGHYGARDLAVEDAVAPRFDKMPVIFTARE